MMAMVKIALFMLVVFTATALENSHEVESNHELHPYLSPSPIDVDGQKSFTIGCAVQCVVSCREKKSFQKLLCIGICLVKCAISPSDSLDEISCVVDCAQSSIENLRYDANMVNDQVSSCTKQCKKD